jgi:hypothetical protein
MTSMTGLDVFDTTIHKTNSWLKEIMNQSQNSALIYGSDVGIQL